MSQESENQHFRHNYCCGDFYTVLKMAVLAARGNPDLVDNLDNKPFREVVELLAPNGIRMVYLPDKHIEECQVTLSSED